MGEQVAAQQAFALSVESGLLKSELQFRQFLNVLPAAAYMCDAAGLITYYNGHAHELWGREPLLNDDGDMFCGSFRLFTPAGEPVPHEECWMALALRFNKEFNGEEIVIEREGGERLTVLAYARPIRDEDGDLMAAVNILVDITERKRAESQLAESHDVLERRVRERTEELEALNRELESFNYSVSHDLRAPLRGIDGFSRALEEDYAGVLDATAQDYLNRIRGGAKRMGALIEALLGFSGIARGGVEKRPLDLVPLADAVIERLQARQPARNVCVRKPVNMYACGDDRLLAIALQNLLENAWKFTSEQEDCAIEFGVDGTEDEQVYFVRDNGSGFDMCHADRIFVPFQRLHSGVEGTGVGLATVQRIVHRHGGRIWVDSEPGAGTTMYFTLPD